MMDTLPIPRALRPDVLDSPLVDLLPAATAVRRYRTRVAWEEARQPVLGASDVPKLLGLSPHGGPWKVWGRKRGLVRRRQTTVTRRGHREEGRILEDYADATGRTVYGPLGELHVVGPEPLVVSPDAFELEGPGRLVGLEVKTDRSRARWGASGAVIERWTPAAARIVREDYAAQVYALLIATGLPAWRLVVRRSMDDLRWFTILRDDDIQGRILDSVRSWWQTHIVEERPPATDDSAACAEALRRIYGPTRRVRQATEQERQLALQIDHWRTLAVQAEQYRRAAQNALLALTEGDTVTWTAREGLPGGKASLTRHDPPQLRVTTRSRNAA